MPVLTLLLTRFGQLVILMASKFKEIVDFNTYLLQCKLGLHLCSEEQLEPRLLYNIGPPTLSDSELSLQWSLLSGKQLGSLMVLQSVCISHATIN